MVTGSRVQAKQFTAAMRGGKDNGDGTSVGQSMTPPGQLLKAMVLKNAGTAASAIGQQRGYGMTQRPRSGLAQNRAPARRRAATARQILKLSTRK